MKNLKISLTAIVAAIILAISTGVYATSQNATLNDSIIKMPSTISNGKGEVTTSLSGGTLSYQFVIGKISDSTISKIQRYEEEIAIAKAYNYYVSAEGSTDQTDESNPNYLKYEKLLNEYKTKYYPNATSESQILAQDGVTVLNTSSAFNTSATINIWESTIVTLYGEMENNWTEAKDGKTVELDLSTFSGTKNVVLWVRYENENGVQRRPQYYKVTGTKKDDDKKDNTTNNEDKKDNTNTPAKNDTNSGNTPKTITTNKSTASSLPHTGVNDVIIALIAVASVVSGIAYIRYRKIK